MTSAQIEDNIEGLIASFYSNIFIYNFLLVFSTPRATIERLKSGKINLGGDTVDLFFSGEIVKYTYDTRTEKIVPR